MLYISCAFVMTNQETISLHDSYERQYQEALSKYNSFFKATNNQKTEIREEFKKLQETYEQTGKKLVAALIKNENYNQEMAITVLKPPMPPLPAPRK